MPVSPTQNSLKYMRAHGYLCDVTEKWVPVANIRKDLYGFIDILCVKDNEVIGVQTTSDSHVSDRVKKIERHDNISMVLRSGIKIVVHGWKKSGSRWVVREVNITGGRNGTETT